MGRYRSFLFMLGTYLTKYRTA